MSEPHPALLQVARGEPASAVADEAALLRSVSEHRMTSAALAAHQRGDLPLSEATSTTLGMWELAERRDHLRFWRALDQVQARLASFDAEVVVLKGIATEARWYDELGQRACTDLDLLLAPSDLARGAELVAAVDPDRGCGPAIEWLLARRQLQHVDLHVDDVQVDLHFDPFKVGVPTRQLDEVWASTEILDTPQGRLRVLRPEIELTLLLLHLNKDLFAFLGPLLDVARIVERARLDWDYLTGFVRREGLEVPVWCSLAAVDDTLRLGLDVPLVDGLRRRTWERLWGGAARLQGDEGRQRAPRIQPLLALHAAGRLGDNRRELRRRLLPPRQLLEVAGRLAPDDGYVRYLVVGRRRSPEGGVSPGSSAAAGE